VDVAPVAETPVTDTKVTAVPGPFTVVAVKLPVLVPRVRPPGMIDVFENVVQVAQVTNGREKLELPASANTVPVVPAAQLIAGGWAAENKQAGIVVAVPPLPSVTLKVVDTVAVLVGTPVIKPVEVRERPAGNEPELMEKTNVGNPAPASWAV